MVEILCRTAHNLFWFKSETDPAYSADDPMSNTPRLTDEQQNDLPREIIDMAKHIAALPDELQTDLEFSYNRVVDSVRRRRRILALVQEALSQLRLDIKYLMFDLEVTRKERDELRERHGEI